jgi:hypothetical protein
MAEPAKIRAETPPPPSRRGLPAVETPADDDASVTVGARRLSAYAFRLAEELRGRAFAVTKDEDLSEAGKRRKVAKETAGELAKFTRRLAEEGKVLARERTRLAEAADRRIRDAAGKLDAGELAEWRAALRQLDPAERSQLLRDAAAGRGPGAEQIMAAAATAASPILLGLGPNDPTFDVIVGQHRERLAEAELAQIAEIDQAAADAAQAAGWLEAYIVDALVPEPELRDAQAVAQGGKPLAELSLAQKVRRASEGIAGGLDPRDALFTPTATEGAIDDAAPPTAADVARFAAQPLAARLDAAERGAAQGLSPAEVVAASTRVAAENEKE